MKRLVKIFVGFIVSLFLLAVILPYFFKDKIQEIIVSEFEKNTEATIYFDIDEFSLSLLKNFPDFTLGMGDFGIVGKGVFEGDTLVSVQELEARVSLNDVLFGESISIKGVDLETPDFTIIVLSDGTANYDIAKASENPEPESTEEGGSVNFGIEQFSIRDGAFLYFDQSAPLLTQAAGINLKGRGDFAEDVFDLLTQGSIASVDLNYDGTEYVSNKQVDIDMVLKMDLPRSVYTFKENEFVINDFPLHIDGAFALKEDGYGMDLKFDTPSSEFKHILSLIPGVYTQEFEGITASGNVALTGAVKGTYNDTQMPAFNLALDVDNGTFQYPDLDESINDVQLHLKVDNPDGVIENTVVDLKQMHLKLGKNPFDAALLVSNLRDFPVKAALKGEINLADISHMFPMDDLLLDGLLTLDVKADGKYDSLKALVPAMDMTFQLKNGKVKTTDIPSPVENIQVNARVNNTSGQLKDTEILVDQMTFLLDGQPFEAAVKLKNPENFSWDAAAKGKLDLEKLLALYPLEGVQARGKIDADLKSQGNMADLDAGRYRNLSTNGSMAIDDLSYSDEAFGKTFRVEKAAANFNNRAIVLDDFLGQAGQTRFSLKGRLTNYLGYFLNGEDLNGNLTAKADKLNINEWMTSSESEEEVTEEAALEVVRIPENIAVTMNANVDRVSYNKLNMTDMKAKLVAKEGKVSLNNTGFKALNGAIDLKGSYDSKPEQPIFDFDFKVKEVSIPAAFQGIDIVQKLAPVTEKMTGLFSTDFGIDGALGSDMMPDYTTLSGKGIIQVLQASLGQSDLMAGLSTVTKVGQVASATLEKVRMSAEIRDGRLFIKPFKAQLGDYETTIAGSTGIDGSIDYDLKMDVPAGQVGAQLNSLVASFTNNAIQTGSNLQLTVGMAGSFTDPKFSLKSVGSGSGNNVTNTVTASVQQKVEDTKEQARAEVDERVNEVKDSANAVVDQKKEEAAQAVNDAVNAQKDSLAAKVSEKVGVNKDSVSKKLEDTKKKAESVLKGLLKKKNKKKKDN